MVIKLLHKIQVPAKKAPKKASKKVEMHKSFFTALPKGVSVSPRYLRFLPMLMGKAPLVNSTTYLNIIRSNVNIK
jgi:hypothetical protein